MGSVGFQRKTWRKMCRRARGGWTVQPGPGQKSTFKMNKSGELIKELAPAPLRGLLPLQWRCQVSDVWNARSGDTTAHHRRQFKCKDSSFACGASPPPPVGCGGGEFWIFNGWNANFGHKCSLPALFHVLAMVHLSTLWWSQKLIN